MYIIVIELVHSHSIMGNYSMMTYNKDNINTLRRKLYEYKNKICDEYKKTCDEWKFYEYIYKIEEYHISIFNNNDVKYYGYSLIEKCNVGNYDFVSDYTYSYHNVSHVVNVYTHQTTMIKDYVYDNLHHDKSSNIKSFSFQCNADM